MNKLFATRRAAAALLAGCIAGASLVSTAGAETPPPATGYTPFIPIVFPIFVIPKPVTASCTINNTSAPLWYAQRDIRATSYQGWSVDNITIRYGANTTGNYTFRIVVRETSRTGDIITKSEMKTVALTAGVQKTVTTYFANSYVGSAFNLSFSHEDISGPNSLFMAEAQGACSDSNTSETNGLTDLTNPPIGFTVRGDSTHKTSEVIEYRVLATGKYFITGRDDEKALLDSMPASFTRTGKKFRVPVKNSFGNVSDVYRFFAPLAITHAYVDKATREYILSVPNTGLNDEGADFGTVLPDASGTCPDWASTKIYRSFKNSANINERNHRYTTNLIDYNAMTALGYTPEGAVFCAFSL